MFASLLDKHAPRREAQWDHDRESLDLAGVPLRRRYSPVLPTRGGRLAPMRSRMSSASGSVRNSSVSFDAAMTVAASSTTTTCRSGSVANSLRKRLTIEPIGFISAIRK